MCPGNGGSCPCGAQPSCCHDNMVAGDLSGVMARELGHPLSENSSSPQCWTRLRLGWTGHWATLSTQRLAQVLPEAPVLRVPGFSDTA